MDRAIEMLKNDIAILKAKQKALHSTLATLRSTPTTSSLRESTDILAAEARELLSRLNPLRSGKARQVSAEEKAAVDRGYANAERKSRLRKKIFENLWGTTCDNLPEDTNKDELWVSASCVFHSHTLFEIPSPRPCSRDGHISDLCREPSLSLLLSGSSRIPRPPCF
ncbi:hypothetical protein GP486_004209, partial [Trichoglossum hirsutum]